MFKILRNREKVCLLIVVILTGTLLVINDKVNQLKKRVSKYEDLSGNLRENFDQNTNELCVKGKPNYEYEIIRRRLRHTVSQFSFLFNVEIEKIQSYVNATGQSKVNNFIGLYRDFKNSLLNDLTSLKEADGFDPWRFQELKDLSELVQEKIRKSQNPANCNNAKLMVSKLAKQCGFGCQIHMIVSGLMASYFHKRTLLTDSKGWQYNKGGWEEVLMPLSDTCILPPTSLVSDYPGNGTRVVFWGQTGFVRGHRPFEPPMLPHDLVSRMIYIQDSPFLWWIGQFLKYIVRYTPETARMIHDMAEKSLTRSPLKIGLHVRRTDKITEAKYYDFPLYMNIVEDYLNQTMLNRDPNEKIPIFLMTDEIKVVEEARQNFTNYEFLTDPHIAQLKPVDKFNEANFYQTIFNYHVMTQIKMKTFTLSSNLGRLILERSVAVYPDEMQTYYSLDTDWIWPFGHSLNEEAYIRHNIPGELNLEVGDVVTILTSLRKTGYLKGLNVRTGKNGYFPAFKTKTKVTYTQYPTYRETV